MSSKPSALSLFGQAFVGSFRHVKWVFSYYSLLLLFALGVFAMIHQGFVMLETKNIHSQSMVIFGALGAAISEILFALWLIYFIVYIPHLKKQERTPLKFLGFVGEFAIPLISENLRALWKSLLWMLLLILPGIYKWIKYSLINFVVILEEKSSELDPLWVSEKLIGRIVLPFILFFAIDTVLLVGLSEIFKEFTVDKKPLVATGLYLFSLAYHCWSISFLYLVYDLTRKETLDLKVEKDASI